MPIKPIVLQRRFAELGRIRLGYQAATQNGRTRPAKLSSFRFTSPTERYIRDLAALYGGEPRPWDNGGKPEHEVFTEATSIPVVAMKGGMSQWLETWSGGGCIHRCDGETNALTGEACDLNERVTIGRDTVNPHEVAKPTTRLALMLPELDAIGAFRMESKGWNAAAEIPAVAELAAFVGDLVPAHLTMVERRMVKNGQTSRFVVPVLDLQIGAARLREVVAAKSGAPLELAASPDGGEAPAALPALAATTAAASPVQSSEPQQDAQPDPWAQARQALAAADALPRLAQIWDVAVQQGLVGQRSPETPEREEWIAAWKARAHELKAAEQSTSPLAGHSEPNADGTYDAEVVEDQPTARPAPAPAASAPLGDADAVWAEIVRVSGDRGASLADLQDDFAQRMDGVTADSADAAQLQRYLDLLTKGAPA